MLMADGRSNEVRYGPGMRPGRVRGERRMDGKVALVTGSARRLGAAQAIHLASLKARVLVADIDKAAAEEVAAAIRARGDTAAAVEIDVTDEASVAAAFEAAKERFGPVEILVNNAGGLFSWGPAQTISLTDWNKTLALCLTGAWLCARAAIPAMTAAGAGRIVNIAATAGDRGLPSNLAPYIAAKGGVAALTRALARELGPSGITVNAVSPGLFVVDRAEELAHIIGAVQPQQSLERLGVPDDLVGAVAFLASDAASFVTGQILNVDGGWSMR